MNEISLKIDKWFDENKRDLPWRHTRDAYHIWLSEIILQQTRVAQGLDYYLRFINTFPTVEALAAAPEDQILKLWQGLGYYSRARHMHEAARQVVDKYYELHPDAKKDEATFPTHFQELIRLQGVGPYTAAAIASFSSDEAVAVVDGNVFRVLSRLFDVEEPIDSTKGQKYFQSLANEMLEGMTSSHHNQALMEFGALHCTPTSPQCNQCPVINHCQALANGTVDIRPVKRGKVKIRERHLTYIIYIYKDTLWVHQRGAGDIWQGLWEFYLKPEEGNTQENQRETPPQKEPSAVFLLSKTHVLTHQHLLADFWVVNLSDEPSPENNHSIQSLPKDYRQVTWMEWQELAVPRLIDEANKRLSAWF